MEPPKPVVKTDFIPDENFSWDFDLNAAYGKNKLKAQEGSFIPVVIRSDPSQSSGPAINRSLKVKLKQNLEFSLTNLDKLSGKGFTNQSNCCFMNVCLQSLLSSPPFFNMLVAIGENQEIMTELMKDQQDEDGGLLIKFV